jgi:hypothetical protein
MENLESNQAAVGTYRATVNAGDDDFAVIIEIKEPLMGVNMERAIEGLAGNDIRGMIRRPSEVIFLDEVKAIPADEVIADPLEKPIQNPNWLPGIRILSLQRL